MPGARHRSADPIADEGSILAASGAIEAPLPGRGRRARIMAARILVFDSGLGGLTVFAEVARLRPDAALVYAADDAGFPYGPWPAAELSAHVVALVGRLIAETLPDVVVIACNTASTLVLADLRRRFPDLPFVGTVPAIKPAAERSQSRMISVLATPGTVRRDYTRGLIDSFAADCHVTLVGSDQLASLAEAALSGTPVSDAAIQAEIAPCFVSRGDARTDHIVLACTHYPLLQPRLAALAPWPVTWIDPAPAIARRVDAVLRERGLSDSDPADGARDEAKSIAIFTSGRPPGEGLRATLSRFGLAARDWAV